MNRNDVMRFLNLELESLEIDETEIETVIVSRTHVITFLRQIKGSLIGRDQIRNWVNTIWFQDFFDYEIDEAKCISSILDYLLISLMKSHDLEEGEIDMLIEHLLENKELETETF